MPTPFFRMPKRNAFRHVVEQQLERMREAARQLVSGEDEEALHDFRVALRKLRVWLKYVGPLVHGDISHRTVEILRHMTQITNAARDAEVQLELYKLLGKEALVAAARQEIQAAHGRVCHDIQKRLVFIEKAVEIALDTAQVPSESAWREDYSTALNTVMKRLGKRLAKWSHVEDAESLHKARIAVKELRYLLEPIQSDMPVVETLVAHLRHLQNRLGDVRDLYVAAHSQTEQLSTAELTNLRAELLERYTQDAAAVLEEVRQFRSLFYSDSKTIRLFPTLTLEPSRKSA